MQHNKVWWASLYTFMELGELYVHRSHFSGYDCEEQLLFPTEMSTQMNESVCLCRQNVVPPSFSLKNIGVEKSLREHFNSISWTRRFLFHRKNIVSMFNIHSSPREFFVFGRFNSSWPKRVHKANNGVNGGRTTLGNNFPEQHQYLPEIFLNNSNGF